MNVLLRPSALALAGLVAVLGGSLACALPASNPCDPSAPEDLQRTATISGSVITEEGLPAAGVTVALGSSETATTDDEGQYQFEGLVPGLYTVQALPGSPLRGGRHTVEVGCQDEVAALDLLVVEPPGSPEVEMVAATAPDRLLVAFASAAEDPTVDTTGFDHPESLFAWCPEEVRETPINDGGLRYWVEVREPFGRWQRAVLNPHPFADDVLPAAFAQKDDDENGVADYLEELPVALGERCLRATCGYYGFANAKLVDEEEPTARCTEVVGVVDDSVELEDGSHPRRALAAFGQYSVRVRVDRLFTDEDAGEQLLPRYVTSDPSAVPGRLSLTPTATMPVPMSPDPELDVQLRNDLDIDNVTPVADGRFALIDRQSLIVVGAGSLDAMIRAGVEDMHMSDNEPATLGGMFFDDATTATTMSEVAEQGGAAVDMVPAGKWVRVWKRLETGESMIDKVWVGDTWGTEPMNNAPPQPVFGMDVTSGALDQGFRGFAWLTATEGDATDPLTPYNPPDAYLLLFQDGVAMLESGGDLMDEACSGADHGENPSFYNTDPVGIPGQGSMCGAMGQALGQYDDSVSGNEQQGACLDLATAMGGEGSVDLTAVAVLRSRHGAFEPHETLHVLADQVSGQVFVAQTDHLLRKNLPAGAQSVLDVIEPVQVGLEPVALHPSAVIDCGPEAGEPVPVVLVANKGSNDVSVVAAVDYGPEQSLRYGATEVAVVPLPGVPVGFFGDLGRPTC